MKGIRFWSVVMALTWFLAGLSAGYLIAGKKAESSPWASFSRQIAAEFTLDGDQEYALNRVMSQHERKRQELIRQQRAEQYGAMEPELRDLTRETFATIRNTIIPISQRSSFDEILRLGSL